MKLSGISPPAASFQDRSLTMLLKNSVNGLNAVFFNGKFLLQLNNLRMRPKFVNILIKFWLIWPLKIKAMKSKSKKDVIEYKKQYNLVVKLKKCFKKGFFDNLETETNSKPFWSILKPYFSNK